MSDEKGKKWHEGPSGDELTGAARKAGVPLEGLVIVANVIKDRSRHVGPVAAVEHVVRHDLRDERIPGLCSMYLLCFSPSKLPRKHMVLFAYNREWPRFKPRVEGATHTVIFAEVSESFAHFAFSPLDVLRRATGTVWHLMTQLALADDRQCDEICRELAEDVADGSLPYVVSEDREATDRWTEMFVHYGKKYTGAEGVRLEGWVSDELKREAEGG